MKQIFILISALVWLSLPVLAADCSMIIVSDGNGCRECALGDFGADALQYYTGADVALLPAGELGISLPAGPIDEEDIAESFPKNGSIVVTTMRREALQALLEQGLSCITLGEDERIDDALSASEEFFCLSGITLRYDASAPAGQRVCEMELSTEADILTVALPAEYAEGGEAAGTVREAVQAYLDYRGTVEPPETGRIQVMGANDNPIIGGMLPKELILVFAAVAILFGGYRWRRSMRERTER